MMNGHSIVIPIFNEQAGLLPLYERLKSVMAQIRDKTEIILVDDGSRDQSREVIQKITEMDSRFKALFLSRNFGHQIAITAGMEWASGQTVTVIDADLQDPPEVILDFIEKWEQGYDVAYGHRRSREGESWFKLFSARIFYRLIRTITQVEIPVDTGDFRLMDRKVVDAFLALPERHRYVRGLISWVGFRQTGVPYDRAPRLTGESHYPLMKMVKLALDGVASFSFFPLKLATWLGFAASGTAFLGVFYILYLRFFTERTVAGWSSLILVSLFLGGLQLIAIGIIGEYIGRMFDEVRQRPLYFLGKAQGFQHDTAPLRFRSQLESQTTVRGRVRKAS